MNTDITLEEKAADNLGAYVRKLKELLKRNKYDLLLGAGNTGQLMVYIAKKVYKELNLTPPPTLILPILRYKGPDNPDNIFDNSILYSDVESQLKKYNIQSLAAILFVDDEIYAGLAVKECLKLLLKYKDQNAIRSKTVCTIVAEDQGISSDFSIPLVESKLELFTEGRDDMSNAITYFFQDEFVNPVKEVFKGVISDHTYINILLNLPIRRKEDVVDKPEFTTVFLEKAQREIPHLKELQNRAVTVLEEFIRKSLHN